MSLGLVFRIHFVYSGFGIIPLRLFHKFLCRNMAGGLFEDNRRGDFFMRRKEERV